MKRRSVREVCEVLQLLTAVLLIVAGGLIFTGVITEMWMYALAFFLAAAMNGIMGVFFLVPDEHHKKKVPRGLIHFGLCAAFLVATGVAAFAIGKL